VVSVSAATGGKVSTLNEVICFFSPSRFYIFGPNEQKFSKHDFFISCFQLETVIVIFLKSM
jgi:hypothetical protein